MHKIFFAKSTNGFYTSDHPTIPSDAVEITIDVHRELINGQTTGKIIVSDDTGFPVAVDPPEKTSEELAISVREQRDKLLAETDYLVMPDYPLTKTASAKIKLYRQKLRDITSQGTFPENVTWPERPQV